MGRQVTRDATGALELRFPFDRGLVDLVKTLPDRRWIADGKYWSVPESDVVAVVDLLRGRGFDFDAATRELYRAMGGRAELAPTSARRGPRPERGLFDEIEAGDPALPAPDGAADDLSVSTLNERVRGLLAGAFPAPVWLVGEISGFDKAAHRKHVTFELVERAEDGRTLSRVGAVLFASARQAVEDALRRAGDPFRLADEVAVRVRATVELYVPWGQYRVVVEELDVRYTLGEAARRREEIVRRLAAAGLLERNRALPLPELPLRVGLVTSLGSDACNDVLRTFAESGFAFDVTVHGARVQGHATEPSVLNALDWLRARAAVFDVVLICRGGGSRTDLVGFDSEALGRTVAGFPLPVVVGIGHEQDRSVLDEVARSCKTPTAAATLVVDAVRASLERVEATARGILAAAAEAVAGERGRVVEAGSRLVRAARGLVRHERLGLDARRRRMTLGARGALARSRERLVRAAVLIPRDARLLLERERQLLERAVATVRQGARRDLGAARERLGRLGREVGLRGVATLGRESERTELRARRLELVHPRRVVERGYAILRLDGGKVVTDAANAPGGRLVRAELRRGTLRLRSEGPEIAD